MLKSFFIEMKNKKSGIVVIFLISYGAALIYLLYTNLHIEIIKLVFFSLFISIVFTVFCMMLQKPLNKVIKYFTNSKYRKMKEKRDKERIVSKR
jgi:hypothetical protein